MRPLLRSLALILGAGACGGKVVVDGAPDAGAPLPPPPPTCAAFVAAVDWSACDAAPIPSSRDGATIYCAQMLAQPGCAPDVQTYYECLAQQHPVCSVYDAGSGAIGTTFETPACAAEEAAMTSCLSTCSGGYSCSPEGWVDCTCSTGAPHAGEACAVYPAASPSLPDCAALCSQCAAP